MRVKIPCSHMIKVGHGSFPINGTDFLVPACQKEVLWLYQPSIHWVQGALSPGIKAEEV
jgi:hypothetical protein